MHTGLGWRGCGGRGCASAAWPPRVCFRSGGEIPGFPAPQHAGRFGTAKRDGKWWEILLKEFSKASGAVGVGGADNSWPVLDCHLAWQQREEEEEEALHASGFKRRRSGNVLIVSERAG